MKTTQHFKPFALLLKSLWLFCCILISSNSWSQQSLKYLLSDNFTEVDNQHSDLLPLANFETVPETGFFGEFNVPTTTCPSNFDVAGYHYHDNAGLRFVNNGFISCEYSIQFTFHMKDLGGPQAWIRLLNFKPSDDNGIYVKITGPPTNGSLEFYPNGIVGVADFFNAVDLYQFVITRTCAGQINIYVNGEFFATYDDSNDPIYLVNSTDDIIDFFQDDTQVGNEASPGWVKNIVVADFAYDVTFINEEWEMFCEVLQETDCAGMPGGSSELDDCGVCLELSDPMFNQSCFDCAGTVNGTAILDECGVCLEMTDPNFNQSCADCAGTPNGTAIIDDCGTCAEPDGPEFNQSCADCAGIANGLSILDECGVCLLPNAIEFNQSCLDCAGVPNGNFVVDECGECLDPIDSQFNKSCTINFYFPTAFSPNEDGFNDVFEIYKSEEALATVQTYQIFNLWGELVFKSDNFEFGDLSQYWDGRIKGQLFSTGVYIYLIKVEFENGTVKTFSGDVAIVR